MVMISTLPEGFIVFYNLEDPRADRRNKQHPLHHALRDNGRV